MPRRKASANTTPSPCPLAFWLSTYFCCRSIVSIVIVAVLISVTGHSLCRPPFLEPRLCPH